MTIKKLKINETKTRSFIISLTNVEDRQIYPDIPGTVKNPDSLIKY
mgnify:CR=1 FL=1